MRISLYFSFYYSQWYSMEGSFKEEDLNLFSHPARVIIAGYSNSGKSVICGELIKKYNFAFDYILYCGTDEHPLQNDSELKDKIIVSQDILNPFDYSSLTDKGILLILDDCFIEAVQTKFVVDAFTKGRHKNISIIFITQNLFQPGKFSRSIALNCSHYILMRNRDLSQVENLGRQIFGKCKSKEFLNIYQKAIEYNKFGYLLIDLSPHTPQQLMLRTNITDETPYQVVFKM